MFFSKIYKSWKKTQFKKYEEIINTVGKNFFNGLILDIGCGPLYFEEFLKKKIKNKIVDVKIVGIDTDKSTLIKSKANIKLSIPTVVADGDNLPFKANSFDKIISFDTMHLIKNNDFKNVLKTNGIILFTIFFNEQNKEEKIQLLKDKLNGFETVKEFEISGKENEYVILTRKRY